MIAASADLSTWVTKSLARFEWISSWVRSSAARLMIAPARRAALTARLSVGWMGPHATDVLLNSKIHETLASAISDCVAAFALSARPREWSTRVLDART